MLNKLLYSSLLCLWIVCGTQVQAQQLKVVAETETFTDYEFHNPDRDIFASLDITIPVQNGNPRYQVLEQQVSVVDTVLSERQAMVLSIPDQSLPLIETFNEGVHRGKRVIPARINTARTGSANTRILTKLRLRIYKQGEQVIPKQTLSKSSFPEGLFASGNWFKIPVSKNGIYQIDADYLEELGLSPETVDHRNIQIWGTGGYVLPEANNLPRPEFTQIPVIIENGGSNGAFTNNTRILFYGSSPHKVSLDQNGNPEHKLHPYSNRNYVFLTLDNGQGERMETANNNLSEPSRTVTSFRDFIWKDEELHKPEERLRSGRYWFGQRFPASSNGNWITILKDTLPGIIPGQTMRISGQMAGRSTQNSYFDLELNGNALSTINIPDISSYTSSEGNSARTRNFIEELPANVEDDILELRARYNHNEASSTGFVNWLGIAVQRELLAENNYLYFYNPDDGSPNEFARYQLSGFSETPLVMDVSDPVNPKLLSVEASGSSHQFTYYSGNNLHFVAQTSYFTPAEGEAIENQHLRNVSGYPDYIIVSAEPFLEYARELANYRQQKDGLSSVIVTQNQILNEFSGGLNDPSAIRDYVKFLYDRALQNGKAPPRYLLLFGDTTYDFKNILNNSFTNHIFTYQTEESVGRISSFATDDFFGLLDDEEGDIRSGTTSYDHLMDIGVGRISAQTRSEAATAIQKIKRYENPDNTGNWQSLFTFAADDDFPETSEEDLHIYNANETANRMNINRAGLRVDKIYTINYPEEITGSGRRVPGATRDFINAMNNGTLVLNYSGHGNETTLADERLFDASYIPQLTNRDRLTVLATATCEFGRYDDASAQSGAEQLFFAENGGAVGAFTTTRVVYTGSNVSASNNFGLNIALSRNMLEQNPDGAPLRFGDIMMRTKNSTVGTTPIISTRNSKKFILIGDPATEFRIPRHQVEITSINGQSVSPEDSAYTTIKALDQVTLGGRILNANQQQYNNFNGEATITVMDAPRTVNLPANREWVQAGDCELNGCSYETENDIIFKGKAAVENGAFTSTFVVPKDINYSDDPGRIIVFANAGEQTAGGSYTWVRFNGINEEASDDGNGPKMDVFLNDERFVNGSLVNSSPNLIVQLEDSSGINTTGTGVGHEIIATIDTKPQQSFVLNDFYEGELNDFTKGRIEYPLDNIPEGNYTLTVRAWDVHNNPSEQQIHFEVASEEELRIRNVYNFPNPMNNATRFAFEHNQPGNPLDVSIRIYTLSGKPVQQLQESLITTSSYASISWDGRDRDYDRLGNGTYIYVLRVTANTPEGRQTKEQIEKLVIIR